MQTKCFVVVVIIVADSFGTFSSGLTQVTEPIRDLSDIPVNKMSVACMGESDNENDPHVDFGSDSGSLLDGWNRGLFEEPL